MRFFNTAGPVDPQKHYCLAPLGRLDLAEILALIEQEQYFVVHAPRQTGKTSSLLALMDYLNRQGQYRCAYVNVEAAQTAREDVPTAMATILDELATWAKIGLDDPFVDERQEALLQGRPPHTALTQILTQWAAQSPRPLLLIVDGIDTLVGDTLLSVLRQIRAGYPRRPRHFPQSVILAGVHDLNGFRIRSEREQAVITGGSALSINTPTIKLGLFSRIDIETLFHQYSDDTGYNVTPEALERIWQLTQGHPWLVNSLGRVLVQGPGERHGVDITLDRVEQAKETLIAQGHSHLSQLADRLEEPPVRRVLEAMLTGDVLADDFQKGDVDYVVELGLVHRGGHGALTLANPLYREIIPRILVADLQQGMTEQVHRYVDKSNGRLDVHRLLRGFQQFCRDHSAPWLQRFPYRRAAPLLLLQAFIQRIIDTNGHLEREYGLGRGRTDCLLTWPTYDGVQRVVIEMRLVQKSLVASLIEGMEQTRNHMVRCSTKEGHLVVFDIDPHKTWDEKMFSRREEFKGHTIEVWGM
ncbi:MAG: AAA family ATPase [Candidatus Competibacterales bacterium]